MKPNFDQSVISTMHEYGVNLNTREIYLHSYYVPGDDSNEPGVDYRMSTTFIKNLNFINQTGLGDIIIHQHCIGGGWYDGIAIYGALKTSLSRTIMVAYAQASSMSGITIQGAAVRMLMPHTQFLVHAGTDGCIGLPRQLISYVEETKRIEKEQVEIFAARCINGKFFKDKKMNHGDVCKYIDDKVKEKIDWFMDPEEAVFYGFADVIIGTKGHETIYKLVPVKKKNRKKK